MNLPAWQMGKRACSPLEVRDQHTIQGHREAGVKEARVVEETYGDLLESSMWKPGHNQEQEYAGGRHIRTRHRQKERKYTGPDTDIQ